MTSKRIFILLVVLVFVHSLQQQHAPPAAAPAPLCKTLVNASSLANGHFTVHWIFGSKCTDAQIKNKKTIWSQQTYLSAVAATTVECPASATSQTQTFRFSSQGYDCSLKNETQRNTLVNFTKATVLYKKKTVGKKDTWYVLTAYPLR